MVITDNDVAPPPPALSVSDTVIGEGGVATFTVSLSAAATSAVSVNYATANGSATAADFTAANGTLNFAVGETSRLSPFRPPKTQFTRWTRPSMLSSLLPRGRHSATRRA